MRDTRHPLLRVIGDARKFKDRTMGWDSHLRTIFTKTGGQETDGLGWPLLYEKLMMIAEGLQRHYTSVSQFCHKRTG